MELVVALLVVVTLLLAANLAFTWVLLRARARDEDTAELLRAELRASREEAAASASTLRRCPSRPRSASR